MGTLAVPGQGAQDPSSFELAWLPLGGTLLLCPLVSSTFWGSQESLHTTAVSQAWIL